MKALLMSALLLTGVGGANAALAEGTCTNATLHGTIAAALTRMKNGAAAASAFMESWDGAGNIQYQETDTDSYNTWSYFGTATYNISKDCIATVYYDGSTANPWVYYIAENGEGYWWINNQSTGAVAAGHAELVSHDLIVEPTATTPGPCKLDSLKGTLGLSAETWYQASPRANAGFESYDGHGHMHYEQSTSDGYTVGTTKGTGTYTVSDRCVGSVYYDGSTTPALFFVAPNGGSYCGSTSRTSASCRRARPRA
jgi:hypothetical protein